MKSVDRVKVIYIVGLGHSGSTLLDLLLGGHSQVFGMGEVIGLNAKTETRCTCGRNQHDCVFWSHVNHPDMPMDISRKKIDFLRNSLSFFSTNTRRTVPVETYSNEQFALFHEVRKRSGALVLVDSSKSVSRARAISVHPNIDAVFVHLVRDGRAATWSYIRKYSDFTSFVFKWVLLNFKIEIFKRRINKKHLIVRYEDLVEKPKNVLEKILKTHGLEYENSMLPLTTVNQHQLGGNRMKFSGESQIRRDDSWRKETSLLQKVILTTVCSFLNFYYYVM